MRLKQGRKNGGNSMLQIARYPCELPEKGLGDNQSAFYLELFGETLPKIDVNYAEVLPPSSIDVIQQNVETIPIYQYWWTLGYCGGPNEDEDPKFTDSSLVTRLFRKP